MKKEEIYKLIEDWVTDFSDNSEEVLCEKIIDIFDQQTKEFHKHIEDYKELSNLKELRIKELQQRVEQLQFELTASDSVNAQLQSKVDELEKANEQLKLDLKASENNAKHWLI